MIVKMIIIFCLPFIFYFSYARGQSIKVEFSEIPNVNGVYYYDGEYNEYPQYVKANMAIRYRGCHAKWELVIDDRMYFKNYDDSPDCPVEHWELACAAKELMETVPTFTFLRKTALKQIYPNPCNPKAHIVYQIDVPVFVAIRIYDVLGRDVKNVFEGFHNPGNFQLLWDGTNDFGMQVASGLYLVHFHTNKIDQLQYITLLN